MLRCIAVHCNALQCVAVLCSVLQCVALCCNVHTRNCYGFDVDVHIPNHRALSLLGMLCCSVLQRVAMCCSVLQCVAACCSVMQCVAVCSSV